MGFCIACTYYEKTPDGSIVTQGIAKTLDLSESGAFIEIPHKFTHPDFLEFELALEDEIIRVHGEIIEQSSLESGAWNVRIQFQGLRPAIRHRLTSFIRNLK